MWIRTIEPSKLGSDDIAISDETKGIHSEPEMIEDSNSRKIEKDPTNVRRSNRRRVNPLKFHDEFCYSIRD